MSTAPHATPGIETLRARLVGRELPVGSYTVSGYEAWLTADAMLAPPPADDRLHPMHVFLASLQGVGYSIQDLFDLVACRLEDGPMIGAMDLRQHRAMRVGEHLAVRSRILDIERKHGRSGVFDRMTIEITVEDAEGETVGRIQNVFIYPRPEVA